jgi:hypothetical protein
MLLAEHRGLELALIRFLILGAPVNFKGNRMLAWNIPPRKPKEKKLEFIFRNSSQPKSI